MSCRTTPAGSAWTTIARLESGLTDVQTLSAFHALRRDGHGVPAPTAEEWADFVENQRIEIAAAGFSEARQRSLLTRLGRAAEDRPDGATFHALRNIRLRTASEALNVETALRQIADQGGETYETVAARYGTYLNEVDRGRSATAPEGYEDARSSWRSRGLPADHGTYAALTRLRSEAYTREAENVDRPRRIAPVEFPNSRAIASAGYDPHDGRLEVTFRRTDRDGSQTGTSRTYGYRGVPASVWADMCGPDGPGNVYNREIRNHEEYRYDTREDEDAAAHRRCAACGQWMGAGHVCPVPAAGEPVSTVPPVGRQRTREEQLATSAEINRILDENPPTVPGGGFDHETGRCIECDGHYRHSNDCPTLTPSPSPAAATAAEAPVRRRGLTMVDQLGNVHPPEEADDYADRVRYLVEVEGMTVSDAQSQIDAEDVLAREAASRAADLADQDDEAAFMSCPDCGQFMDGSHTCPTPTLTDEEHAAVIRDLRERLTGSPDPDGNREPTLQEMVEAEAAVEEAALAEAAEYAAETEQPVTPVEVPTLAQVEIALHDATDMNELNIAYRAIWNAGPDDEYRDAIAESYNRRVAQIQTDGASSVLAPEPETEPPARPEPITAREAGVYSRRTNLNRRGGSYNDPGYYDRASVPPVRDIRAAAVNQPVIVPVSYTGRRWVAANADGGVGADGLPGGSFQVVGSVTFDRPGRGQWNVSARELQCNCAAYQANYHCPHVDMVLDRYRAHLVPATRAGGTARNPVDPAVAQRAAEEAIRQDWMRSEEGAAEARARHAAASSPEDSYTETFAAFKADHDAALARKAAGEHPVPFMTENVLNGEFTRESGRGLGVELELDFPNTMSRDEQRDALRAIGQELYAAGLTHVDYQQGYHSSARRGYTDVHARGWSFEQDCTVAGEIVSPVMYDEPETWENIAKVCEIVKRHGGIANAKTGSHVHVGAKNMTTATASELIRMTNQHEDIMYRISQNPDRATHRSMRWCGPNGDVPQGGYQSMGTVSNVGRSHGHGMNLAGVRGGDSDHPEVRYWDGTLDPAAIQAQIKISAALVMAAERNANMPPSQRNREPIGSHQTRLTAVRGRSRRALTEEELTEDTATFRSFVDTLFTRREDKAQAASLFAVTNWQRRPR